jgi:hypothetical protein
METAVSRKPAAEQAITLRDADISSERAVSRRSLLGVLGVGVAASAIFGATSEAPAADADAGKKPASKKAVPKKTSAKKAAPMKGKKEETDSD